MCLSSCSFGMVSCATFVVVAAEEAEAARRQQQDTYRRSRQRDEFDSEDDGDFIVDDLGTEHRQGSRHREER